MPTPPGFATCSYELKHSLMTRSAFLTFGVDPTETDPAAVASLLRAAFAASGSLFSILDANVTLQNTRVSLGTDGAEDIVGSDPTTVACTLTLVSTPPNCAVLAHKTTARGGRRGRGRMYLPWVVAGNNVSEAGALQAGDITRIQNGITAWRVAVGATAGPLVLLHRNSGPAVQPPTVPGPPNPILNMIVDPLIATQRRRLGR